MKIYRITHKNRTQFQVGLAALEKRAVYPLGDDYFQIDHGADYFHFFERLGDMIYYVLVDVSGEVVGAGAGIIRTVPFRVGQGARRSFYLCDFKIAPEHRGNNASLKLATHGFFRNYLKCPRGYAISMNDPNESSNRIVHLAHKFRWASVTAEGPLLIFSLSQREMMDYSPVVRKHRGAISYLTLGGVKDIVLQRTGRPMALAHVQFGPCASQGTSDPLVDHVHMFCTPANDPFAQELHRLGLVPSASATIIAHRMPGCDWRFILTSDI